MKGGGVATVDAVVLTPDNIGATDSVAGVGAASASTSTALTSGIADGSTAIIHGIADNPRDTYLLELEQQIAALHRATRVRAKVFAERFDPDLQPAGFAVLRYIIANEPIRAGGIAAALAIDKSAISRQLTVLRDGGFIETRHDPDDGRATLLVSTPAARTALTSFRADVTADYERIVAAWPTEEVASFAHLLRRFTEQLT